MPDLEPPTLGEVMRRLDSLLGEIRAMREEMKADRADAAKTYVRQDLWAATRTSDGAIVADLVGDIKKVETNLGHEIKQIKEDRKADLQWRRQVQLSLGILAVTALLSIAGLIISLLTYLR